MAGEIVIEHPNRDKASSKVVKLMVVAFLVVSAVLVTVVTVGGWGALAGAQILQIAYLVLSFRTSRALFLPPAFGVFGGSDGQCLEFACEGV